MINNFIINPWFFFVFSLLQPELAMVLYPMFVHMYLELVYKGSEKEGKYYNI